MLIIVHKNCRDGFGAAWALRKKYPEAEIKFALHGKDPPDVKGRDVIIADFSYKRAVLEKMHAEAASLVVLDHHKSAEEDLKGLDYCVFDMEKSGAVLAWEYAFPDMEVPWILQYVQDRDLWRFELSDSKAITGAIYSYPMDWDTWDELSTKDFREFVVEGTAIQRFQDNAIRAVLNSGTHKLVIGKHEVLAVSNSAKELTSELGHLLYKKGSPFGAVWWLGEDRKIHVSLRSGADGVDVSKVAGSFGGGGHHDAAGFTVSFDKFTEFLFPDVDAALVRRIVKVYEKN